MLTPGGPNLEERCYELVETSCQAGAYGDREEPSHYNVSGEAPAHGGGVHAGAHPNNGTGDGVGGAHGDAHVGRGEEHDGGGGFCGESVDGFELGDAVAQGPDDPHAAGGCAKAHHDGAADLDPEWNSHHGALGFQPPVGDKTQADDAHGLLGVILAVGEGHGSGGNELEFPECGVHLGGLHPPHDPQDQDDEH